MAKPIFIAGPDCRNKHHTNTRRMKCPKIDRHWLGVSEQEWRPNKKQ